MLWQLAQRGTLDIIRVINLFPTFQQIYTGLSPMVKVWPHYPCHLHHHR